MGFVCCNQVCSEKNTSELALQKGDGIGKIARSKTIAKKEHKQFVPKTTTDAVVISSGIFVLENQGIISKTYDFVKQLGQGSYGTVYKAIHKKTKEKRAIKFIEKSAVPKDREGELFNEIKVLKEMHHHSIMKIYEFSSDEKYYYLVGEFIEGGELFDEIIKRKYMSEKDAAYIIRQVLAAITYCHSNGIAHRDLKPENILIASKEENGNVNIKIIDFGAALFISPHVKLKETLGTPYYIAPEVLMGNYTEKCDVWSIGVILFILLSGSAPFNGRSDDEIMNAVKKGAYTMKGKIWDSISPTAKDLVKAMLTYDPEKRITASDAYKHPWLSSEKFIELDPAKAQELVANMSKFYSSHKLQQAAMIFIVSQLMSNKEKEELGKIFMALDKNGDGTLTKEELLEGYTKLFGNKERALAEVTSLMQNADVDKNGSIDYTEFLLAAVDRKRLLSKGNVKQAFDLFDVDKCGTISPDEVKQILGLGQRYSEETWKEIVAQVDINSDGQISYEEFEEMMLKFTS